ncbi:MAG: FRG domain-containing protein [Candidatus Poribacteria bacterium]|nr:FRG domain-containing protein [Candidatus Poribacteria bacterium]
MSTPSSTNPQDYYLEELSRITSAIVKQSANGNCIYRGEPETYDDEKHCGKVSSTLYRTAPDDFKSGKLNLLDEQEKIIKELDSYLPAYKQKKAFEIWTELQHYGTETNLIDFTTDYHIALFFACNGSHDKPGRVIVLNRTKEIDEKYDIDKPLGPVNRIIAQKSIFAQPRTGYLDSEDIVIITVPANLKTWTLIHLRKFQDISTQSVYNDLHGFIRHRNMTWSDEARLPLLSADTALNTLPPQRPSSEDLVNTLVPAIRSYNLALEFAPYDERIYYGQALCYAHLGDNNRASETLTKAIMLKPEYAEAYTLRGLVYSLKGKSVHSISDYNRAKILDPEYSGNYFHCGIEWLRMETWECAISNLLVATDKGEDIVAAFCNIYKSVTDFEQKNGVTLPQDIAAMLQPEEPPQIQEDSVNG